MPRWIWIAIVAYALVMMSVSVIVVRDLPWREALMARDFSNVWIAGQAILSGDAVLLYDREAFTRLSETLLGFTWGNNYSYPPHSLFLAAPFGLLSHPPAFFIWNVAGVVLFALAARPYLPPALPWWAAVLNPATLVCIVYGHYGLLIGALWLWSFRGSGIAAGLATLKPHLGLMIFIRTLADRRQFLIAVVTTLFLVTLSAAAFGIDTWRAFVSDTSAYQSGLFMTPSDGARRSMVVPFVSYGLLGQMLFAVAAIVLLSRHFSVFTAATATFLILPYGYHYDMTVACLGFAVLAASRWETLAWWEKVALLVAFFVPQFVRYGAFIAPPILLLALWLQVRHRQGDPVFGTRSAASTPSTV
ncbi:glycosyltransferase family 87 protein [Sphingomicrobium clamense]|uniref:DUF2029 domain-containing protein n=1 Tax=Sphingomicrobium clamense TaxID=2851013 RepID=A0ABS6V7W1_9SPHN|nr:glycosyltransferase family 87 protein [Sphingomicrobium sp. B8]MBW0145608.1 DUF2029 domain-containing protein [Sphingomicrobium sp. B8]